MRRHRGPAAAAMLLLGGCVAERGSLAVYEENDVLSVRGRRDGFYTQGFRASRTFPASSTPEFAQAIADFLPTSDDEAVTSTAAVLGQNIYTPKNQSVKRLQREDRPYGGWLYVGGVVSNRWISGEDRTADRQETIELDLGVTGKPSLAEHAQTLLHRWTHADEPKGWDNQIRFEPGVVVTYENRHRLFAGPVLLGTDWDFLGSYGGAAGNVATHAFAGGTVRYGVNVPRDFGVNTISSTAMDASSSGQDHWPSLYVFASAEGRAVARNIFLDGNTWRDSHSVEKEHAIAECKAGIAIQYKALRLTYTWITRSPEFEGQGVWTKYGSLSLGLFFDF